MDNEMERVDFLIPKVMNKKITKIAKLIHTTRSEVIRNALRDYLDKKLLEIGGVLEE
jgi:metal-responsive CopG/Arc/MetJ family transcriptional regulator